MSRLRGRTRDPVLRILSAAIALVGLASTLPLMIVIALAVRLTSRGPAIYRQRRIGLNRRRDFVMRSPAVERRSADLGGKPFTIYKFRSMEHRPETEKETWAAQDDPRTTRLGGFLRGSHLDELPQLVNVLLGQMCIVGPRPEQPELFRSICCEVPEFTRRQRVPPGITGLAQVALPYARSVEDARRKLELDLDYIGRRSVGEDVRIMWRTALKLIGRADESGVSKVDKRRARRNRQRIAW